MTLTPARRMDLSTRAVLRTERIDIPSLGTLAYRANRVGSGRALVLLHGFELARGCYEFGPLQSAFSDRPTYALDWPGYGASSELALEPNTASYAEALAAFIEQVAAPDGQPVDVIAAARAGEVAALLAARRPRPIRSLVLLNPTGFGPARRSPLLAQLVRELQRVPRLCDFLYRARRSTAAMLATLSGTVGADAALALAVSADHGKARPGAFRTPFSFLEASLSGQIGDVSVYRALRVPTFVLFDRSQPHGFDFLPEVTRDNAFVRSLRMGSRHGAPHLESTAVVESAVREFYAAIDVASRFEDWESTVETVPSFAHRDHRAA
ncbi:MAG TPA: alpha/beta fold hydrolase [Polyangiaceae bacterium]|nr:alpha/beta fold hydrolase [Polyangiaceae bacterium]